MAKLTNIQASQAAQIVGIGVDDQVNTQLSQSLAEIVGKTYTFQIKLNDFNFTLRHQTFTVSRIFPRPELGSMPAFVIPEAAKIPEEAMPEVVAPGTDGKVGKTWNDAEPSTSGAPIEVVAPGEKARKKDAWNDTTTRT